MGDIKLIGALVTFIGAIFDSLASRNDTAVTKIIKPSAFQLMFYTCLWVSFYAIVVGMDFPSKK